MLTKIREKATGIFAWVIVIIITIPFALWGINSYFEGPSQTVVASAEGVDIDLNTYQRALAERQRMMAQVFQQNIDPAIYDSREFKLEVLNGLIANATQASFAERSGYRISDSLLGETIRSLPYFQVDGRFDVNRYENAVANAGMSIAGFEQQQRQQMIADQIRSAYADSVIVTSEQLDGVITLLDQARVADYAVLSSANLDSEIAVSDEEARAEYDANQQDYFAPEQMKVDFLKLSVDSLAKEITVTEDELQAAYEANKVRYKAPETRRVSHILVSLKDDADETAVAESEARVADLLQQLAGGADFAELARENSDDKGSARSGGDLGVLAPGVMVKPFEDAAFALSEVNQLSEPVRSRFGFHIIKLTELKPESIKPFADAREEVETELKARLAEEQFLEQAEMLSNRVYEEPESLDPAADELQLEIETSEWFSRASGEGVAANDRLRRIAFAEEVRVEELNSEAFELDPNTLVAIRKADFKERALRPFDEVKDDIKTVLVAKKQAQQVAQKGAALLEAVSAGGDWQALLTDNQLQALEFSGTRQDAVDVHQRNLVEPLFSSSDKIQLPHFGGVETSGGDYILYRLRSVNLADPSSVSEERREEIRSRIRRQMGDGLFAAYQQRLREESEIQVFEENL